MKIKNMILGAAALLAALATTSQAVPLTGNYALAGTATLNSVSVNTATQLLSGSGLFNSFSGNLAAYNGQAFALNAWSFNSGPVVNLWSTTDLQFNLVTSTIKTQGGGDLIVDGTGLLFLKSDPVGSARDYTFNFTTQDPNIGGGGPNYVFSFSVSGNPVPEGGSTVLLLGAALVALAMVRRQFAR
jgi:hypothetical protein